MDAEPSVTLTPPTPPTSPQDTVAIMWHRLSRRKGNATKLWDNVIDSCLKPIRLSSELAERHLLARMKEYKETRTRSELALLEYGEHAVTGRRFWLQRSRLVSGCFIGREVLYLLFIGLPTTTTVYGSNVTLCARLLATTRSYFNRPGVSSYVKKAILSALCGIRMSLQNLIKAFR